MSCDVVMEAPNQSEVKNAVVPEGGVKNVVVPKKEEKIVVVPKREVKDVVVPKKEEKMEKIAVVPKKGKKDFADDVASGDRKSRSFSTDWVDLCENLGEGMD